MERFHYALKESRPVMTLELSPPKGVDASGVINIAQSLSGLVDAINVPDCQRSILKMSALATSKLILDEAGIDVVWQLTCRDRNVIALQADLMGAYALGIRTVLALTGDPVQVGDQSEAAKQVFHLEAVRLLQLVAKLNRGEDAVGQPMKSGNPDYCVGSALNPFRLHSSAQQKRLCQKLEQGVDFFQTQPVYSVDPVLTMMDSVRGAASQVGCEVPKVLVGIIPPRTAKSARFMNAHVAGIDIPQWFIDQLESAEDPPAESIRFCADLVAQCQEHTDGFHFMPVGMQKRSRELMDAVHRALGAPIPVE